MLSNHIIVKIYLRGEQETYLKKKQTYVSSPGLFDQSPETIHLFKSVLPNQSIAVYR